MFGDKTLNAPRCVPARKKITEADRIRAGIASGKIKPRETNAKKLAAGNALYAPIGGFLGDYVNIDPYAAPKAWSDHNPFRWGKCKQPDACTKANACALREARDGN